MLHLVTDIGIHDNKECWSKPTNLLPGVKCIMWPDLNQYSSANLTIQVAKSFMNTKVLTIFVSALIFKIQYYCLSLITLLSRSIGTFPILRTS